MLPQGDYWSFNLAGSYLPLVLLRFNVNLGNTAEQTYRQYVIIYLPGIVGAVLGLFSVQLPLLGRKWSLVFSAAMQGLSMALYTQVRDVPGYVGLNALEYIMQTVGSDFATDAGVALRMASAVLQRRSVRIRA